ncbi:MAG: alpha/beta hydrolase [Solirubrobacteraceae bacterium]
MMVERQPGQARAVYLQVGPAQVFALHSSRDGGHASDPREGAPAASTRGIMLCAPFGNEDICSYRARRDWALLLAREGFEVLRLDLPGSGNSSGGPRDRDLLEAWCEALQAGAAWLRGERGCDRVGALGIGMGGLLAHLAAARGAPMDDLVLWGTPARGRAVVREIRAFGRLEGASTPDTGGGEDIVSGGFLLTAETLAALAAVDLAAEPLGAVAKRRVLLLSRDNLKIDARLTQAIEEQHVALTVAVGEGYGEMIIDPQRSRVPHGTVAIVGSWLGQGSASGQTRELPFAPARPNMVHQTPDCTYSESPLWLDSGSTGRHAFGILTAPPEGPVLTAVFLNAGALRNIGPNRMWVEAARRWVRAGVASLRLDLEGIGDADGDASALREDVGFYSDHYTAQVLTHLDALQAHGLPGRFVLVGLCSGAYWALHAAASDSRVCGAFMVNPRVLMFDPRLGTLREARSLRKALSIATWRHLLEGRVAPRRVAGAIRSATVAVWQRAREDGAQAAAAGDPLMSLVSRLASEEVELAGIFSAGEPVYEELQANGDLERMNALSHVELKEVEPPIASHTLEPLALQSAVHAELDSALARVLAGRAAARAGRDQAPGRSESQASLGSA